MCAINKPAKYNVGTLAQDKKIAGPPAKIYTLNSVT